MTCPTKIGQNWPSRAYMRPQPPTSIRTDAIRRTVCVPIVLYICMLTKVIGINVAVKMIPHMLTIRIDTSYPRARSELAGAKHRLSALTIMMQLTKRNRIGHRSHDVLGTNVMLPDRRKGFLSTMSWFSVDAVSLLRLASFSKRSPSP